MSTGSGDSGAPYADAISNIRDTIKWLAASFASIAAVVVANTPFSNIGSLPVLGWRFNIAMATLAVAFICVVKGLYRILMLLAPDDIYASDLENPAKSGRPERDQQELETLRKEINDHAWDLLPKDCKTVEWLVAATRREEDTLRQLASQNKPKEYEDSKLKLQSFNASIGRLLGFAVYKRLFRRLRDQIKALFWLGVGALVTLFAFSWAANPPKAPTEASTHYFVVDRDTALNPARSSSLDPVLFALGSAEITPQGLAAIERARDFLRIDTHAVLLLRAHTDTLASDSINRTLARRRGETVQRLLLEPGGVAANRVFVAELPKKDLPNVTGQQTADASNRSVELLVAHPFQESVTQRLGKTP